MSFYKQRGIVMKTVLFVLSVVFVLISITGCNGIFPGITTPISPGTYSGDLEVGKQLTVNGESYIDSSGTMPYVVNIGPNGLPIHGGSEEIKVGEKYTLDFGDVEVEIKVLDITVTDNGVTITYSVIFEFDEFPRLAIIEGRGVETIKKLSDTSIEYILDFTSSNTDLASYHIYAKLTGEGTLNK